MRGRTRRELTRIVPIAVMVGLAAMLLGATGPASGAADKKIVSASFSSPTGTWGRGSTISNVTLDIKNSSGSQQLGSADLCVPDGLTGVTGAIATPTNSPCAGYSTSVVKLRNLAIAPGITRPVNLGTVSVSCTALDSATWKLHAKQSNDFSGLPGNNFTPYPNDIAITITGACTLEFVTRPADAEFDSATGTSDAIVAKTGGPAIEVRATSGSGAVSGVGITITSGAAADLTGGGATQTNTAGIASFATLKRSPAGGPYTLSASADGFTSDTSDVFFVVDLICEPGANCTVTKQVGDQTSISATQSGFDGPVGILVDGEGSATSGLCVGGLSAVGDDFRIEVRPLDGNTEITWRYTKSKRLGKPENGQNYELCVGTKLAEGYTGPPTVNPAFPVLGGGSAVLGPEDRHWGVLTEAPASAKCDASYPLSYPAKIAEYSSGADAIQVACFPYPFDPKGIGVG